MRIRQTEKRQGKGGCLRDVCHRSKLTRQEKEGGEVYEEKDKNSWTVPDDHLAVFAIPGFGKVQASREDDVFDGWQELEDEAKKEEELEAQSNQTLEIGQSGEYTVFL
mgnify:CR=1 FL=1